MTMPAASGISCLPGTARRAEAPTICDVGQLQDSLIGHSGRTVLIVPQPMVAMQLSNTGK